MSLLSDACWSNLAPRPRVRSVEWIPAHVKTPDGRPIDFANVPWAAGVCDAWDDPHVQEIALMWSARQFKSLLSASLLICAAANNPQPMLFGSSTEKLAKRIVAQRLYPMLEQCDALRDQLRPRARRSQLSIELRDCRILAVWSGSESQLADTSAVLLHANEVDKWDVSASREGEPLDQFCKRSSEYPDRKILIESTPGEVQSSRIYAKLLAGDNRRFHVPCPLPRCGVYQRLKLGTGDPAAGGIVWDKPPGDGHSDPDLAYRTARYRCPHCGGEWGDELRARSIRRGVWVPEGQRADERGRLQGAPRRPNSLIWSSQLSSYYALHLGWGDIAREFVSALRRPAKLKAFRQLTEGWPWELRASKTTAEQLGERLRLDLPAGTLPVWGRFLVLAVDVQERSFPWLLLAIGSDEQRHLVGHGTAAKWAELRELLDRQSVHADGGPPLAPAIVLIDSGGHHTLDVYRFARKHSTPQRPVIASKGSSGDLGGARYQDSVLPEGKARRRAGRLARGQRLCWVAIDCWEEEIQQILDELRPGEPGALTLSREAAADAELLAQLLNGVQVEGLDPRGNARLRWQKKDDSLPNDFRDCLRYGLAAAALYLDERKGRLPERLTGAQTVAPRPAPAPRFTTPDGRPYLLTERDPA